MNAVGRLLWTYFMSTPLLRWLMVLVLLCTMFSLTVAFYNPDWLIGNDLPSSLQVLKFIPLISLVLLLFASAYVPAAVEKIVTGRLLTILPGGRASLFASILIAGIIFAVVLTGCITFIFRIFPPDNLFVNAFITGFVGYSLTLLSFWVIGKAQGIWRLMSMVLLILSISLPLMVVRNGDLTWIVLIGVVVWLGLAIVIFAGRNISPVFAKVKNTFSKMGSQSARSGYHEGEETKALLGIFKPWIFAIAQLIPLALASILVRQEDEGVWLVLLVSLCAINGAITSQAATKSRALWLKLDIVRSQLFKLVESIYWGYTAYSLGVLLMAFVVIGSLLEFSTRVLALGLPLLILSAIVSAYLGLLITRGLGWLEVVITTAVMALILQAAFAATDPEIAISQVILLESVIGFFIIALRVLVSFRWSKLDWALCRPESVSRPNA